MLRMEHVKKSYGMQLALDDLNMEVCDGALYGFVGPNGAGKTTAIRLMCGLLHPDEGTVLIDSMDAGSSAGALKARIGYVPDYFGTYQNLTVREYMDFFASCYDLNGIKVRRRIGMLLDMAGLSDREDLYVDALSRGMQQKLSLARALIHDPKLLILDEPTSGLDPGTRYEFKQIIGGLAENGKTVIISSHILTEISELCSDIGIINHGKMVMQGRLSEIMRRVNASNPIIISLEGSVSGALKILRDEPLVRTVSVRGRELQVSYDGDAEEETQLLARLVQNNVPVRNFSREKSNLEALFLQLTGEQEERQVLSYEAQSDL